MARYSSFLALARTASAALIALTVATVGGCSSEADPGAQNSATLAPGSHYLPQSLADVANVQGDSITFPMSMADEVKGFGPGNVIIAYRQTPGSSGNNPDGFMVKIVSASRGADGITFETVPASMQDAFSKMDIAQAITLQQDFVNEDIEPGTDIPGTATSPAGTTMMNDSLRIAASGAATHAPAASGGGSGSGSGSGSGGGAASDSTPALPGVVLLRTQNYPLAVMQGQLADKSANYTAGAQIKNAQVNFVPKYDFSLQFEGPAFIRHASAVISGQLIGTVDVTASLTIDGNANAAIGQILGAPLSAKSPTMQLAQETLSASDIPLPGIGNLPVSLVYTLSAQCNFTFAGKLSVDVGGTLTQSVQAGFTIDNNVLTNKNEGTSPKVTQIGPTFTESGSVTGTCALLNVLELKIGKDAASVGGDIELDVYAGLGANLNCGTSKCGALTTQPTTTTSSVTGAVNAQIGYRSLLGAQVDVLHLDKSVKCQLFNKALNFTPVAVNVSLPPGVVCTNTPTSFAVPGPDPVQTCGNLIGADTQTGTATGGSSAGRSCASHPPVPATGTQGNLVVACTDGNTAPICCGSGSTSYQTCGALSADHKTTAPCCGTGSCPNATDQCVTCGSSGFACVPQGCTAASSCGGSSTPTAPNGGSTGAPGSSGNSNAPTCTLPSTGDTGVCITPAACAKKGTNFVATESVSLCGDASNAIQCCTAG